MKPYIMEGLGTFFLLLAALFTGNPFAVGLMLMAMIYCGGHISGGHFNPAVTLAVWLRTGLGKRWVLGYMVAQTIGAFVACYYFNVISGVIPFLKPAGNMALWKATCIESMLTFAFCFAILNIVYAGKLKGNDIYGLAIGLTLTALMFTGTSVSGAIFNPAIGLATMMFHGIKTGGFVIAGIMTYIIGPLLGGAIAAYGYRYLND